MIPGTVRAFNVRDPPKADSRFAKFKFSDGPAGMPLQKSAGGSMDRARCVSLEFDPETVGQNTPWRMRLIALTEN